MLNRVVLGAAAVVLLAGCGSGSGGDDATGASPGGPGTSGESGTSLTIVATAAEGADPQTYELTCDPAGGDHPQPEQACAALAKAGAEVFEPVPADQVCTEIFGGPQTATVTGTYEGEEVDASFSRANGCEIYRWEKLGTTVFAIPLQ